MAFLAFISTALLMLIIGFFIGVYCGRQVTLNEIEKKDKKDENISDN